MTTLQSTTTISISIASTPFVIVEGAIAQAFAVKGKAMPIKYALALGFSLGGIVLFKFADTVHINIAPIIHQIQTAVAQP